MFIWLDYVLLISIGLFGYVGYRRGFILVASDLIGLIAGMFIGGIAYAAIWNFAVMHTSTTAFVDIVSWAVFLGFYLLYWTYVGKLLAKVPDYTNSQPLNCYAGIIVGGIKGFMYCCLLMLFVVGPLGIAQNSIGSTLGSSLLKTGIGIRAKIIPATIYVEENNNEQNTTDQTQP